MFNQFNEDRGIGLWELDGAVLKWEDPEGNVHTVEFDGDSDE